MLCVQPDDHEGVHADQAVTVTMQDPGFRMIDFNILPVPGRVLDQRLDGSNQQDDDQCNSGPVWAEGRDDRPVGQSCLKSQMIVKKKQEVMCRLSVLKVFLPTAFQLSKQHAKHFMQNLARRLYQSDDDIDCL